MEDRAASKLLLLIAIAIGLQNDISVEDSGIEQKTVVSATQDLEDMDDFLVTSLFVDDTEIDAFTTDYLVDEVIVRAELSEQELENIFINSLFVDDTLVDEYLEENLVEQIVL